MSNGGTGTHQPKGEDHYQCRKVKAERDRLRQQYAEQGLLIAKQHNEIDRLRQRVAELEAARKLCRSDFEKWISNPPYEHMCDRNSAEGAWPGQYKRYETQLAWEAWQQALSKELEISRQSYREVVGDRRVEWQRKCMHCGSYLPVHTPTCPTKTQIIKSSGDLDA